MKKSILLFLVICFKLANLAGQCASSYTYAVNSVTANFANQSNVTNAHYFWNFGDGTGSNLQNPVHVFPETGKFFVTLFAKDTVSNCSSFYETWIKVTKISGNICQPDSIKDSVSYNSQCVVIHLMENSQNCNNYGKYGEAGLNSMPPMPAWICVYSCPARYVGRVNYNSINANNQYVASRELYKTIPFRYNSAKNYNSCSANFEFQVVSQSAGGQRILFKAMNKTASFYQWTVETPTSIVTSNNDTVSCFYPYDNKLSLVHLITIGSNGCKDTLCQVIASRSPFGQNTSLSENRKTEFKIYPNPFKDTFYFSFERGVTPDKVIITNVLGQKLLEINEPKEIETINTSEYPNGIYFIRAENKQGQSVFKIVKE